MLLQQEMQRVVQGTGRVPVRLLGLIVRTSGVPEIPGGFLDDAQILAWFTNAYKRVGEEAAMVSAYFDSPS
jgi:hypothetical protein